MKYSECFLGWAPILEINKSRLNIHVNFISRLITHKFFPQCFQVFKSGFKVHLIYGIEDKVHLNMNKIIDY